MNQNYLKEFQRWTAGPKARREMLSAEFAEHLREAEAAGELGSTLTRLGPPRDAAKAFAAGHELRKAPLARRITAFLMDAAIPAVIVMVALAIATAIGSEQEGREVYMFFEDLAAERTPVWGALQALAAVIVGLGGMWWVLGLTIMEWRYGRGPGKAMMGLRVVTEDGIAPTFGQVIIRRLTLVFSGPLQIIDWVFALFDPRRQRAVEKLAHTLVVQDETPERQPAAAGVGAAV
ncbi:MAG: RDD family protein [Actinomycetota bacterium]